MPYYLSRGLSVYFFKLFFVGRVLIALVPVGGVSPEIKVACREIRPWVLFVLWLDRLRFFACRDGA